MAALKENTIVDIPINWANARVEFDTFKKWFEATDFHDETSIQNELVVRPHLIQLIGRYYGIGKPTKVSIELEISNGKYKPDIVVLEEDGSSYCAIELEDAAEKSIFSDRKKNRSWSPRFEAGFSQCVDWAIEFSINKVSENNFTNLSNVTSRTFGLLIGVSKSMNDKLEEQRFEYRSSLINTFNFGSSCFFELATYSKLLKRLNYELQSLGV